MKTLPKVIKSDSFTMTQVMREDDLAIYRRTKQVGDRTIEHFEVIVVRVIPESQVFGQTVLEHEKYPASEAWGMHGWTCYDLDAAWERIRKIRAEREEREERGVRGARA